MNDKLLSYARKVNEAGRSNGRMLINVTLKCKPTKIVDVNFGYAFNTLLEVT